MKKVVFVFFLAFFTMGSYAQVGELTFGVTGGYVTQYKDVMYGVNASYHLADPIEVSFTGLFNPNVTLNDEFNSNLKEKLNVCSLNLDLRYYMLHMRDWATGPVIGYQYLMVKDKKESLGDFNASGFNLGWHLRFNITDDFKVMGGWRYTMANEDARHHFIYLGVGYTFSLF